MADTKNKASGKDAEPEVKSQEIQDLEAEAREKAFTEIEGMSTEAFRQRFGELFSKIANHVLDEDLNQKVDKAPGFLLEADDPFARAIEKVFTQAGGISQRIVVKTLETSRLPIVMPYKEKAAKTALQSYLQRAEGSGDVERSQRARAALAKCK